MTDGHLPYPFGREVTGFQVGDLAATLTKAKAAGATVLSSPTLPMTGMRPSCNFPAAISQRYTP